QLGMGDRDDLLGVHTGNLVQQLDGDAIDLLHRGGGVEDRAVLRLDDDLHGERRAEHVPVGVVELDVRVVGRVQALEVGLHHEAGVRDPRKEDGDYGDDQRHANLVA